MRNDPSPPGDEYKIRCPRLGHMIPFSYCRGENRGLPCFKTLDCWFQHFMVEAYFEKELPPEKWEAIFNRLPKTKVLSLIELIEQAKKRGKKS